MGLAQGHNAVTPVRLEPTIPRSRVKHSTTEPLHSSHKIVYLTPLMLGKFLSFGCRLLTIFKIKIKKKFFQEY